MSAAPAPRYANPRRLTTGPYLARNPLVLGAMVGRDVLGLVAPGRARALPVDRPLRVLVANTGHLGDLVVMLPLLETLRRDARVGEVGVLIGPWGKPVFDIAKLADRIHVASHWSYDRAGDGLMPKLERHARSRWLALHALREAAYDVAIDVCAWFGNASDLLWAAGIPMRAGFTSGGGGTLYTHRVPFDPRTSIVANQHRLFRAFLRDSASVVPSASYPGFEPDPSVAQRTAELGSYVVVHVGAGSPQRAWPQQAWIELCRLLRADGTNLVFTGAAAEADYVRPICEAVEGHDYAGRLDFRGFTTLIRGARGLVCVDTVAGHLAAAFEVPSAVLINGIQPADRWRPNQRFVRLVTSPVGCAPCSRTSGCAAMACLQQVTPQSVHRALQDAIAAKATSP